MFKTCTHFGDWIEDAVWSLLIVGGSDAAMSAASHSRVLFLFFARRSFKKMSHTKVYMLMERFPKYEESVPQVRKKY